MINDQRTFLRDRVRHEWDQLFNPPPAGIAAEVRHGYLSSEDRTDVRSKCGEILRSGSPDVGRLLTQLDTLERRARDLRVSFERIGDRELAAKRIAEKCVSTGKLVKCKMRGMSESVT